MKVIGIDKVNLTECVKDAQHESVVLTLRGKPIALVVGVAGMDLDQLAQGHSDPFWQLLRERRKQKTISRAELEKQLAEP
jgi:antitoxin (DNA-binding transcriptional repressor) of toxin-antitoxin stability system